MGKIHDAHKPMEGAHGAGRLWLQALIASFAFVVAGCATPGSSPNSKSDPMLIEARVVNTFGDSVMSENRYADPTLALGAIPGDIRGSAGPTLQFVHL